MPSVLHYWFSREFICDQNEANEEKEEKEKKKKKKKATRLISLKAAVSGSRSCVCSFSMI
jgi:hypothetical protein